MLQLSLVLNMQKKMCREERQCWTRLGPTCGFLLTKNAKFDGFGARNRAAATTLALTLY